MWTLRNTAFFSCLITSYKVNKASSVTKDFSRIVSKICCINSFSMLRVGLWGIPVFYLKFHTYVQEWDRHYFFSWYCLVLVLKSYWPHRPTWGIFPLSGKLFGKSQLFCEIFLEKFIMVEFCFLYLLIYILYNTIQYTFKTKQSYTKNTKQSLHMELILSSSITHSPSYVLLNQTNSWFWRFSLLI